MKRVLVAGVLGGLLLLGAPTLASSADRHGRGDYGRHDHGGYGYSDGYNDYYGPYGGPASYSPPRPRGPPRPARPHAGRAVRRRLGPGRLQRRLPRPAPGPQLLQSPPQRSQRQV